MFLSSLLPLSQAQGGSAGGVSAGSAALQQLTEYRKSHRRTIDGRLCAAAFVQDDQTYTDCTAARAPNGTAGKST